MSKEDVTGVVAIVAFVVVLVLLIVQTERRWISVEPLNLSPIKDAGDCEHANANVRLLPEYKQNRVYRYLIKLDGVRSFKYEKFLSANKKDCTAVIISFGSGDDERKMYVRVYTDNPDINRLERYMSKYEFEFAKKTDLVRSQGGKR